MKLVHHIYQSATPLLTAEYNNVRLIAKAVLEAQLQFDRISWDNSGEVTICFKDRIVVCFTPINSITDEEIVVWLFNHVFFPAKSFHLAEGKITTILEKSINEMQEIANGKFL